MGSLHVTLLYCFPPPGTPLLISTTMTTLHCIHKLGPLLSSPLSLLRPMILNSDDPGNLALPLQSPRPLVVGMSQEYITL